MAESLAVVGLIVPGVAMMFAAGALIATGALSFPPICAFAVAGAVVGDGLSFWLGRKYHEQLKAFWPFRTYPGMIDRGVDFFQRFGGRSILFGRFVGPVRAVIPMVAGMLDMPTGRFLLINVISALLWAPAYLFPGMVFGASLELASKVAGRLVVLLILLLSSLWFVTWLSKILYSYFQSHAHQLIHAIFDWGKQHPKIAKLTDPILDPNQRDYASLTVFAVLIVLGGLGASLLIDSGVLTPLHVLHIPWTDYIFAWIASLAGYPATFVLFFLVFGWLFFTRQDIELAHWIFAFLFCLAAMEISEHVVPGQGRIDGYVLRAGVMYGFLAVLLAGDVSARWRGLIYTSVSLFTITILFARLYLKAASFENVVLTLAITLAWTSLLGVAYRRHRKELISIKAPTIISILIVLSISLFQLSRLSEQDLNRQEPIKTLSASSWWHDDWKSFSDYRVQMFGKPDQPLNVQWAASLDTIRETLHSNGWREAHPMNMKNILHWLSPQTELTRLPVLPHFNEGEREAMVMLSHDKGGRSVILRLWPSGQQLASSGLPIWIGSVAFLEKNVVWGFLAFPEEETARSQQALELFIQELNGFIQSGRLKVSQKTAASDKQLALLLSP